MRRLGLDIGTNSIGWCLTEDDARIVDIGVRIFSDGRAPPKNGSVGAPLAEERRLARGARRRRDRYLRRRSAFMAALVEHGLMPADADEAKLLADRDPYELRARALVERLEPHEIGRALFHLNQRRGFKSNRKANRKTKENEDGKIKQGEYALDREMHAAGADTLGQFLFGRTAKRVRMDTEAQAYDFYPQRRHYMHEFRRIWDEQAKHYPRTLVGSELSWDELDNKVQFDKSFSPTLARDVLYRVLFFQRPLKEQPVGKCLFVPSEDRLPRAHPLFQERRLYEEVNHLEVTTPGAASRKLKIDERDRLVRLLREKRKVAYTSLARELKLEPGQSFNKASQTRTEMLGDEVFAVMRDKKRFGDRWPNYSRDEQWTIVERVLDEENPDVLHAYLTDELGLDEERAAAVAKAPLPEMYGRIGATASARILDELKKDVIHYREAVTRCGWHKADKESPGFPKLPYYGELLSAEIPPGTQLPSHPPEKRWGKITNPTVHIGLRQLEKLVNALIDVHGRPDQIVVELARELKLNERDKEEHNKRVRRDTAAAIARSAKLTAEGFADTGANRMLLRTWEELNPGNPLDRRCPYCGGVIGIAMLFNGEADVDHIIPYSRSLDDSAGNKVVSHRSCNRAKGNKTPWERWGDSDRWDTITAQVSRMHRSKQWRFGPDAMARVEKDGGFIARQLTDTQYLSRHARDYLSALYPDAGKDSGHVYVIPGRMTAMLRRLWGLNSLLPDHNYAAVENKHSNAPKNRLDHRHHAIDAAVIAVSTRSLLQRIARTAGLAEDKHLARLFQGLEQPWTGFREELGDRLRGVTVSHKPDHGRKGRPGPGKDSTAGKLHDDTAYGLTGKVGADGKTPVVVKRISFSSLDPKDISDDGRIRDDVLRRTLREATAGLSGKSFEQALSAFSKDHPLFRGIRRVRVLGERPGTSTLDVIPIRDKAGKAYKAYKGNANARFQVWRLPDGSWKHQTVSMFQAHQKGGLDQRPHPAAKKVLDLRQNDLLAIERAEGGREIVRVVKFSGSGQVTLAAHNESGNLKARDVTSNELDPFKYVSPTAGGLKKLRARQVRIDPLGRIFDPGPR